VPVGRLRLHQAGNAAGTPAFARQTAPNEQAFHEDPCQATYALFGLNKLHTLALNKVKAAILTTQLCASETPILKFHGGPHVSHGFRRLGRRAETVLVKRDH
jgi:hypothetical protein